MSAPHTPWTFEVHELSEGFSAIVYDARGLAIADHADEATARLIAAAPELYEAARVAAQAFRTLEEVAVANLEHDKARNFIKLGDMCRTATAKARGESPHNQSNPKVGA